MKAVPPQVASEFDRHARDYRQLMNQSVRASGEPVEYFAALKARYLQRCAGEVFGGAILDYGCGVGLLSRALLQVFPEARVDGYDPSEVSLEEVPAAVAGQGRFSSDLRELRNDYDLIAVANVVHHVAVEDRQALIDDLASRLAGGGSLFLFEHNPLNPLTRRAVRLCPFDADAVLLWPAELRRYLEKAGLRIEKQDYIVFFPRLLKWLRPLEPALTWCALGAQYVVSASKT